MKKIITIFVLVIVLGGTLFFLNKRQVNDSPLGNSSPSTSPSAKASQGPMVSLKTESKLIEVSMLPEGLSKNNLTIQAGDTVKFTNKDTFLHWPASGPHPSHTLCPGFDSGHGLKQNESYSFTFDKKMVCSFHDHLYSRDNNFSGVITVK